MDVAQVKQLLVDPETLMRRCYVHVQGSGTRSHTYPDLPLPPENGQAPVATFRITIEDIVARGFTTGLSGIFGLEKSRAFVKFEKLPGDAKVTPADDEINAFYVPMVQVEDVLSHRSHYTLPTAGPPDIMLTGKLSGCRLGVGAEAEGAVLVSHIQPDSRISEDQRQGITALAVSTQFGNTPPRGFARGETYVAMAAVIGVLNTGRWSFYQQASSYEGANGGAYVIDSVRRVRV